MTFFVQIACYKACFEVPVVVEILNKCRATIALISRNPSASAALKYHENVLQVR